MSNFKVGQKIVAIKDHAEGYFKKGDIFTVLETEKTCCVNSVRIFTSKNISGGMSCYCGKVHKTNMYFFDEKRFVRFTEMSEMSYNEAIEMVSNNNLITK